MLIVFVDANRAKAIAILAAGMAIISFVAYQLARRKQGNSSAIGTMLILFR